MTSSHYRCYIRSRRCEPNNKKVIINLRLTEENMRSIAINLSSSWNTCKPFTYLKYAAFGRDLARYMLLSYWYYQRPLAWWAAKHLFLVDEILWLQIKFRPNACCHGGEVVLLFCVQLLALETFRIHLSNICKINQLNRMSSFTPTVGKYLVLISPLTNRFSVRISRSKGMLWVTPTMTEI